MEKLLIQLTNLPDWQIALLATYLLLQGFLITVFPEEIIITTLGLLWSQGRIDFHEALIAVWVGLLPANAATVFIGHRFGPPLLSKRPFVWFVNREAVEDSLSQVRKHGPWIVFLTRFTPIIRGPIYLAAGLSRMGLARFMKIDALAACVQVPALLLVGSLIGKNANSLMDAYQRIGMILGGLLVFAVAAKIVMDRRKRLKQVQ